MTKEEKNEWRARGMAMATLLRHDLPDCDWRAAMKVLSLIGATAGMGRVARIAIAAKGADGEAVHGIALRRAAREQLIEALSLRADERPDERAALPPMVA